jgi:hypothetical protein
VLSFKDEINSTCLRGLFFVRKCLALVGTKNVYYYSARSEYTWNIFKITTTILVGATAQQNALSKVEGSVAVTCRKMMTILWGCEWSNILCFQDIRVKESWNPAWGFFCIYNCLIFSFLLCIFCKTRFS